MSAAVQPRLQELLDQLCYKVGSDEYEKFELSPLEDLNLIIGSATSQPGGISHGSADELVESLATRASPRELLLATGEQLEKARNDIGELYLDDEDGEPVAAGHKGDIANEAEATEGAKEFKTKAVLSSISLALSAMEQALPRLITKKDPKRTLEPILEMLNEITDQFNFAGQSGVHLSSGDTQQYLLSVSSFCSAAWTWYTEQTKQSSHEHRELFSNPLLKAILLFHGNLQKDVLDRWYTSNYPNTMSKYRKGTHIRGEEIASEKQRLEGTLQLLKSSVDRLGLSSPNLLLNIIVSPSGFLPHVSLFLLIASPRDLPGALEQDIRSTSVTASEVLDQSMPVLGSAFQGMAVDSAAIWVWELVRLIEKDEGNVDEMTAQMLVELIMPVMANDPSDITRFALHRLVAALINLVESPLDQVMMYEQLVSPTNPFEEVRLSGMALLREAVVSAKSKQDSAKILNTHFTAHLAPILFELPESEPAIKTVDIKDLVESMHPAWLIETLNLLFTVMPEGKQYVGDLRGVERWVTEIEGLVVKWEKETQAVEASPHEKMELEMPLFAIGQALSRAKSAIEA